MDQESGLPGEVHRDTASPEETAQRLANDIEQLSSVTQQILESLFLVTRDLEIARQRIRREVLELRQNQIRRNYITGQVESPAWINGTIDDVSGL